MVRRLHHLWVISFLTASMLLFVVYPPLSPFHFFCYSHMCNWRLVFICTMVAAFSSNFGVTLTLHVLFVVYLCPFHVSSLLQHHLVIPGHFPQRRLPNGLGMFTPQGSSWPANMQILWFAHVIFCSAHPGLHPTFGLSRLVIFGLSTDHHHHCTVLAVTLRVFLHQQVLLGFLFVDCPWIWAMPRVLHHVYRCCQCLYDWRGLMFDVWFAISSWLYYMHGYDRAQLGPPIQVNGQGASGPCWPFCFSASLSK